MIKTVAIGLAVAAALGGAAHATELAPKAAYTTTLGDTSAVAFYTLDGDAMQVSVTTQNDGDIDHIVPVRFTTNLADGQNASVVIPGANGLEPLVLELVRQGDALVVGEKVSRAF
ncbi:hypothetical protein [Marinivivus vitaminiproducens]|uniref:hypothetical protein n=1 Tax=Marinivivus vitaminiproducens TaxID=3035935 RepID=UPI0027A77116|nr:hypothetical protein P4R82_22890 [Geminicoccaceae bacterium SCSIO 64248]